jgi:hypothetical protein
MSKSPKNIEKTLLGVAGLAAVGFAAMGFMKSSGVAEDFPPPQAGPPKGDIGVPEAEATSASTSSLKLNRAFEPEKDANGNPIDQFVGIRLFADKNNPNEPKDIRGGDPVHPPIDNKWWVETGADPTYANSPARDDDGDGFSNLDEFQGKTDPLDKKKFPPLIDKLAYLKDESTMWYVQFGFESEGKWAPKIRIRTPDGKQIENKVSALEMIKPGETFFKEKEMAGRFKFTGIIEKEVTSERTNLTQMVKFGQYEDLKPNKAGDKYESQYGLPDAQLTASAYYDRFAVLDLQAVGYAGQEFKVEERAAFALPSDAPEKNYFLKQVTPDSIVVEYKDADGATQTKEIKKGTP